MTRTTHLLVALGLAASVSCAPGSRTDGKRPNVILISVDTLRADHLGSFGYSRDTSPFIDSLGREGVRFVNAFSPSSWTLPAHMSLITSAYPHTHGVQNTENTLAASVPTLAETLKDAGYRTTGFVSWTLLSSKFGFGRGFDRYEELFPPRRRRGPGSHNAIKAGPFVDRVLEWVEEDQPRPYFLFLHLFDPHMSYEPPLEQARAFDPGIESVDAGSYGHLKRYIRGMNADAPRVPRGELAVATSLYDGEIHYVDGELRRLFGRLDERGLLDNTLIVFTSDHGEELDEHGSMEGHGWTLYDEVLHVPLTLVLPERNEGGTHIDRLVSTLDIAPTILDVVGLTPPATFEGSSLAPHRASDPLELSPEIAFAQIRRFNAKWSLRTPSYKLIYTRDTGVNSYGVPVAPGYEMYDLATDRAEQNDIFDPGLPETAELVSRLETYIEDTHALDSQDPGLSEEELERLRSLGYLAH